MKKPKIVMVGIGHAGIAALNIVQDNSSLKDEIKTVAIDLKSDALAETTADKKIKLTLETGNYLGYYKPALVKFLAGKSKEEIQEIRKEVESQRASDTSMDESAVVEDT